MLEETTRKCSEKDITIFLGDMHAKVGNENTGYEQVMGKHGIGTMNENGEVFPPITYLLVEQYFHTKMSSLHMGISRL